MSHWRYPADGSIVEVDGLSLGGRLGVIGPNGAGKTTLLRLIAGTLGDGEPAGTYLPQRPHMFRGSVRLNLSIGLATEEVHRAMQLFDRFGLDREMLDAPAVSLSGGERQRVALARALARPASPVLLDEPLTAFAAADRPEACRVISEGIGERDAVIIAHDLVELAMLADRLAVLIDGRVRQSGALAEVLAGPADQDVASLMGVSNVVDGTVMTTDDGLLELAVGARAVLGMGSGAPGDRGRALFAAESVAVHPGGVDEEGSPRNHWPGIITDLRDRGRLVEVFVDVGFPVIALVTRGSADALGLASGESVELSVKATAIRIVGM